jgi:hypothetical protein
MPKSWPFALAVVVVGGLAGLAIAGRPVASDPFVLGPGITSGDSPSSSSVGVPTTSIAEPVITTTIATTTTVQPSTSVAATVAPSTVAPSTVAPSTVAPSTVAPIATAVSTTTVAPTTTAAPTATVPGPLPRNQVRLVIANGDGRFRLAGITADRIRSLGYIIDLGNAVKIVDATVIYYRPGFDDEAAFAAIDIGVPDAIIIAFPTNASQPITDSDTNGDVIIVLGPDAPR